VATVAEHEICVFRFSQVGWAVRQIFDLAENILPEKHWRLVHQETPERLARTCKVQEVHRIDVCEDDVQLVKIQLTQSSLLFSTPLLPCLCALSAAFLGWQCGTTFWRKFSSALLWQHSIVVVGLSWHNSVRS
jgi:hypothetical protein